MSTTWINRGHFYVPHVRPVMVDCNFKVASTDSAGLGITSLKGQGVSNVFMHTTQTPGKGTNGQLNPNPASGIIVVQFTDNFSRMYQMGASMRSPASGSNVAVNSTLLTVGNLYQITSVGTSTAADWIALGLPPGITPQSGVSFVAIAVGAGSGSGQVQTLIPSGINHIEFGEAPSLGLSPIPVGGSPNFGGWVNLLCYANGSPTLTMSSYTPAGTVSSSIFTGTPAVLSGTISAPANAVTAPVDGTVIFLSFYMNQSSVTVDGE